VLSPIRITAAIMVLLIGSPFTAPFSPCPLSTFRAAIASHAGAARIEHGQRISGDPESTVSSVEEQLNHDDAVPAPRVTIITPPDGVVEQRVAVVSAFTFYSTPVVLRL
jgi:hypothetical protein